MNKKEQFKQATNKYFTDKINDMFAYEKKVAEQKKSYLEEVSTNNVTDDKKFLKAILENVMGDEEETADETAMDMETPAEGDDEASDPVDTAEETASDINLEDMSVEDKLELVSTIIDSVQNGTASDEEFSDFMNQLLDKIDEFKFEDSGEEDEEMTDEEPMEDEEPIDEEPMEDEEPVE